MKKFILFIMVLLTGCDSMCGSEQLSSQLSPNGKLKAISYLYDCGATTGFSTQVSILAVGDEITSSGNVITTDGKNRIILKWLSDSELLLSNTKGLKVYKRVAELDGINVSYQ
ncbi:MAG: hypothetical protein ACI8VC_001093 [Candidatus Endobugula sp.]|jgi:hypothetical protein